MPAPVSSIGLPSPFPGITDVYRRTSFAEIRSMVVCFGMFEDRRVSALFVGVAESRLEGACYAGSSRLKVALANVPKVPSLSHETWFDIGLRNY